MKIDPIKINWLTGVAFCALFLLSVQPAAAADKLKALIVDGQNKLVPSISFTLKNVSDKSLVALDLNAKFYRVTEPTIDWDTDMVNIAGSEGFAAGASSKHLTIDSKQGYKGTESRIEMLKNSQFVDAKVAIFAKYSNTAWVRLGDYDVPRQLIAR